MADQWNLLDLAISTANRIRDWGKWYIMVMLPGVRPPAISDSAPSWYRHTYSSWSWRNNLDSGSRPTAYFLRYYIRAVWNYFLHKIRGQWDDAVRNLREAILTLLGSLAYSFASWHDWLVYTYNKMGGALAIWCWNLADGINRLYDWLPWGIREGVHTWLGIFEYWYGRAKDWVILQYGNALAAATDAWDWVVVQGQALSDWFDNVGAWVLDWAQNAGERVLGVLGIAWEWLVSFYNDPWGIVKGWLGPAWTALVSWYEGPLTFYYNLWGEKKEEIGEFWADPLMWLYDKAEDELIRRW